MVSVRSTAGRAAVRLVLLHGAVGIVHGAAHSGLGIVMSPLADLFIYGVV